MQRVHGIYLRPKKKKGNHNNSNNNVKKLMPLCKYGSACNRGKACIYRHERKKCIPVDNRKVCLAYLADICPYGKRCTMRHPNDEEAASFISMFASQPCRFGSECRQAGCLYFHPEVNPFSSASVNAMEWTPSNNIYNSNNKNNDPTLIPQQWPKQEQQVVNNNNTMNNTNVGNYNNYSQTYQAYNSNNNMNYESTTSSLFDQASKSGRRNYTKEEKTILTKGIKSVEIPIELWQDQRNRDSNVFLEISNPLQRFGKVNENSSDRCIDLHFIAKYEVEKVLNVVLPQYKGDNNIWIITGTGHHKEGHQAEGVLFYTTAEYLRNNGYVFKIGIDSRGFRGALFLEKVC